MGSVINPFLVSPDVTVTFTDNAIDAADLTTYTFSARAIGTAAASRKVVVGVVGDGSTATVSTLTVGGVSATLVQRLQNGVETTELWQAAVSTGATADIVVTWSVGQLRMAIGVWAVYDAASAAYATATSIANPPSTTINVPAGGVLIGVSNVQETGSWLWTNLTERYDQVITAENNTNSGASDAFATEQLARSITATQSTAPTLLTLVLASWAKA